jgi:hypothetical protein
MVSTPNNSRRADVSNRRLQNECGLSGLGLVFSFPAQPLALHIEFEHTPSLLPLTLFPSQCTPHRLALTVSQHLSRTR